MWRRRLELTFKLIYNFLRVFIQLIRGVWRVSKLPTPLVSIFGGARIAQKDSHFAQAHDLAQRLVINGISVLTGGGPGIMQAVNCGITHANEATGKNLGIGVIALDEERDPCLSDYIELDYFFARKWLLTHYSQAFIIFPGGYGTLDELFEVLTLMQTKKMDRVPIILVGTSYWQPFIDWLNEKPLKYGAILSEDIQLFSLVDDIDTLFDVIKTICKK